MRAEAVQVNRIGLKRLLTKHRPGVADAQRQQQLPFLKNQPVQARQQAPKLAVQLLREYLQFRVRPRRAQHIVSTGRKGFRGDEMQQPGPQRVGLPGLPGEQEIKSQSEAGFENAPLRLAGPGSGQAAAMQKDVAGLGQATEFATVAITKARVVRAAAGCAIVMPRNGLGHGLQCGAQVVGGT